MIDPEPKPVWPLAGLRVIDLSDDIAGPYATKLFVDAGARVIKVEDVRSPDPLREWSASGSAIPKGEEGSLFRFLNASKHRVTIDPSQADDAQFLQRLIATADLVVESGGPRGLQRGERAR